MKYGYSELVKYPNDISDYSSPYWFVEFVIFKVLMDSNSQQKKEIAPGIILKKYIPRDTQNMYVF